MVASEEWDGGVKVKLASCALSLSVVQTWLAYALLA